MVVSKDTVSAKPLVSIVLPAYNEQAILKENIKTLYQYLESFGASYDWEVLVVNDGSSDDTGVIAESMVSSYENLRVFHHRINRNLGNALRTGFKNTQGDYVIVLDLDLSYATWHIEELLNKIRENDYDMVIASPYMKGGKNTAVPLLRLLLSKTVNFIMRKASGLDIFTFTGMARAYDGNFIRSLNTKSSTFDINSEIIFKAHILRAKVTEIPAHLDWTAQRNVGKIRTSGLRIVKGIFNGLVNSFIFRPYWFFMLIGLALSIVSFYVIAWIFYHVSVVYPEIDLTTDFFNDRFSESVSYVYNKRPHAFFVGGITLVVAIQFLGLGFISLQKKRYFDELFHINTELLKASKK